jgi:tRNA_anti-like
VIQFTCSECNATLKATDERAGTRFKCGKCGNPVTVPTATATATASAAPAAASAEKLQLGLPAHPTPQRTPPRSVPIVWVGVAVAAAALLGMCAGGGMTAVVLLTRGLPPASTPAPLASASPTPDDANPVKVTVNELWSAYRPVLAAGDAKYAGKLIEISGVPATIKKDYRGRYLITACEVRPIHLAEPSMITSGSLEDVGRRAAESSITAGDNQDLPGVLLYIDKNELTQFVKAKGVITVRGVCSGAKVNPPGPKADPDFVVVVEGCTLAPGGR